MLKIESFNFQLNSSFKLDIYADFESACRNRYFSTTAIHKKFDKLKQRKQLFDEPVTTYIDDIVNLCKEVDPTMSDSIIIQHLMSGLNPNLRMELCRHAACIHTLHEFMKYAKIEQDLYDTFGKSRTSSPELTQRPYYELDNTTTPQVTTTIRQPRQQYKDTKQDGRHTYAMPARSSVVQRNSNYQMRNPTTTSDNRIQNNPRRHTYYNKSTNYQVSYQHGINNCKICDPPYSRLYNVSKFSITGSRDGGVPSKFVKPSTTSSPVYIKIFVNDQPTEAIIDTGSAISFINLDFLKTIHHSNLIYQTKPCQTANSTPLNIIGHIRLKIKMKSASTYAITYITTNLITPILLGNDWINSNHVYLFGDQKQLTIPDQHGQLISIPYVKPAFINYPALLVHQITIPPYSQTLVDITCPVDDANNFIFEPYERYIPRLIFIPHTLLNINKHQAKVLLINAQDQQQILSKNTRIGTISRETTYSVFTTTEYSTTTNSLLNKNFQRSRRSYKNFKNRDILNKKDNSNSTQLNVICELCNEYFLSGNDLQKHLRAKCYSDQIRKHILESTKHMENKKQRLAIQDILWRNKILFDPTPSIINIPSQSAIRTGDHPPIYSKQYSASYKDQDMKFQETQKLLERGQIEESTSPWSSPIVLVKKKDKTMRFCIDYRRLNAITIKDAYPLPRIDEIFDQLSDALYYTKFDFKSGYFQVPLSKEDRPKTAFSTRDNHYQLTVLPQGITNGPARFQRVINHILGPTRWKYTLAYIDDVIIYSKTFQEHLLHVNEICTILKNARFRLNPEKCEIARTQTDYLGHNVKNGEIRPSSHNINGLLNTKLPQTADEACKFVKAAKYYRKFISKFSRKLLNHFGNLFQLQEPNKRKDKKL
ncbi:unnamed protein product [Rotaria magnacalcarata]|uniref:Reverse transcriptase domain-containing protein n=2 Tax=Rotaria magnacalcarata TaxID=392030 RepID=A0A819PS39_9BILA|nr:unnamed protein product [Rotaria magnacalcarata]CAF4120244.1 unnamed protein product [Rotaria magnacalcarata]